MVFPFFRALLSVMVLCLFGFQSLAQSTPLASTPPMGWNSWNHFAREVTDADVRSAADALISSGMKDAGYIYVNIDDTWQGTRDDQGNIRTNERFPDMKGLADYVHSKGLKLGIYSSPGPKTCAGFEGSYQHEDQDARTYAGWGIDYLKYDLCSYRIILQREAKGDPEKQVQMMKAAYEKMHQALVKSGRPIVYSLCQYGLGDVWTWGAAVGGNLWRTTGDIRDSYTSMASIGFNQIGIAQFAGPGHWNDPDMLEVGNGGMTPDEERTHMSLWTILAAPLLAGNDLSKMTPETLSILTNRDVIAVDQDPLGKQGERVAATRSTEVWAKPLQGGGFAVGLFNRGEEPASVSLQFADLDMHGPVQVRDLWTQKDLGKLQHTYTATVPRHGVVLVRLTR